MQKRVSVWPDRLLISMLIFLFVAIFANAREILVVLDQNTLPVPNITKDQQEAILDALRGRAQDVLRDQVIVLTSATTLEVLRENDIDIDCIDASCQISLARSLQSRWMLSSKIIHINADYFLIQLSLYDTETSILLGMEECKAKGWLSLKDCACDHADILFSMVGAVGVWPDRANQGNAQDWNPDLQKNHVVKFVSQPAGATLYLNGSYQGETPCSRILPSGAVRVKLSYPRYEDYIVTENIIQSQQLHFELIPTFGYLSIFSEPTGQPVVMDGQELGYTPIFRMLTGFGAHQVIVGEGSTYYREMKIVQVSRGDLTEEHFVVRPRLGALDIRAHDIRENALILPVLIDGQDIGETPLVVQLPIGQHRMQVGQRESTIEIREQETLQLDWLVQSHGQIINELPVRMAKPSVEMTRRLKGSKRFSIDTNLGSIVVELDYNAAPYTCQNFERYVEEGHYEQSLIHRVVPGFVIQGGGFDRSMKLLDCHEPIINESSNGLKNIRGSLAMARKPDDSNSADCQFFINLKDNPSLDSQGDSPHAMGYCVFGKVVLGMDIVDRIAKVSTGRVSNFEDVPVEAVVIQQITKLR